MSDGLFFRVKESSVPGALEVELRKRLRFGSLNVDDMLLWPAEHASPEAGLERVKARLLQRNQADERQRVARRAAQRLLGDHDA